jgi:hypothetical protein
LVDVADDDIREFRQIHLCLAPRDDCAAIGLDIGALHARPSGSTKQIDEASLWPLASRGTRSAYIPAKQMMLFNGPIAYLKHSAAWKAIRLQEF